MIIQNRTISVALTCKQRQTSKKAHKILISQIALKLQWLLPSVIVTSNVISQFYVGLFFELELVLVMIRVGARFRL